MDQKYSSCVIQYCPAIEMQPFELLILDVQVLNWLSERSFSNYDLLTKEFSEYP